MRQAVLILLITLLPTRSHADPSPQASAPPSLWQSRIEEFLRPQLRDLPGRISVRLEGAEALPACDHPAFSLPDGRRPWGRIRVGARCETPQRWTRYLAVMVSAHGRYLVSARRIDQGQAVVDGDLTLREGELTPLPAGVLTDPAQAVGRKTRRAIAAGLPLQREQLIQPVLIRQGDKVKARVRADSFTAEVEAVALTAAGAGENIRIRTEAGKILTGTAREPGLVELPP